MRLIDADKLLQHQSVRDCSIGVEYIISAPSVDALPVVRCKDCIHYEQGVCLKIYSDGDIAKEAWCTRKDDDFCSYGEGR